MIYADNAATTRMSRSAIEAMLPYMDKLYGNPSSLYSFGQEAKEALEDARARVAKCLGCDTREITFTSGGSEADNQAIFSAARLGERKGKKHIISTAFEHHAVLHTLDKLKKQGFEITLLDVHENGIVTAQQVADAIREDTCLVTIMFANNEIGTIQPIAEIGKVCREKQVLFHTDAVQAAGHIKVNATEQNIDMLSISAHKFHGPKGIGVLYAKRGIMLDNVINGGAQERGKRAGTENLSAIMGMTVALEEAVANLEKNSAKLSETAERLMEELKAKEKEIESLTAKLSSQGIDTMLSTAEEHDGIRVACGKFKGTNSAALKTMADTVLDKAPDCIAVMFAVDGDKANLCVACGKAAQAKGAHAGKLVKAIAELVGGKGGGKPERAMAGVGDISKIDSALNSSKEIVINSLK